MKAVYFVTVILFLAIFGVYADFSTFYGSIAPEDEQLDPNVGLTVFPTLLIPIGGRYEGMGTAFTAVANDAGFLEANPSASSLLDQTELVFSHNNWIADSNMEGVVYTIRFDDLGIGFGGKFLYVPFTEYDTWGERVSKGYYSESIATMNISYNFFSSYYFYGLAVGANMKVAYRNIPEAIHPEQSALGIMGDFGVLTRFNFLKFFSSRSKNFSVGGVVKNLGPFVLEEPLPTEATFGIAYSPLRPVTLSFDFTIPFSFNPGLFPAERWSIAGGADIAFTGFFSVQTGFKYRGGNPKISLGSTLNLRKIRFVVNYTLDLTTSSNSADHFSIQAELKLGDRGRAERQALIDEYYTAGLEAYAEGRLQEAIDSWNMVLELDPDFQPASEMKRTVQRAVALQKEMEAIQQIE
jgi:hypothetical protein